MTWKITYDIQHDDAVYVGGLFYVTLLTFKLWTYVCIFGCVNYSHQRYGVGPVNVCCLKKNTLLLSSESGFVTHGNWYSECAMSMISKSSLFNYSRSLLWNLKIKKQ